MRKWELPFIPRHATRYTSIGTPVQATKYENNLPTFHTASISKTYFSVTRQMTPYGFKILAEKNVHNFWKTLLLNSHLAISFVRWTKRWSRHSLPVSHLSGGVLLAMMINLALPCLNDFNVWLYPRQYLPDFITRAKRALVLSNARFYWLGKKIEKSWKFTTSQHNLNWAVQVHVFVHDDDLICFSQTQNNIEYSPVSFGQPF